MSLPLPMTIVAAVVLGTIAFALLAVRRIGNDPAQFILGGRSFGTILLWVLMGGELYTTFTFLGIAGWVYGRGAEIYYILAVGGGAYILAYLYLPRLWRFANERQLLTFGDFFAARYASKPFGAVTALISTCTEALALLIYLTGLQIILAIAGLGAIDGTRAVLIAFGLITLFVFTAGLRGMAWASIVKDVMMFAGITIAGFVLPIACFGSPSAMLAHAIAARPHDFTIGGWTAGNGKLWYITTAIINVAAFFVGVNAVAATYSARSEKTVRRNAMLLPLYSIMLVPMFFAGYTASLVLPGLHGTQSDSAYLRVLQAHFPLWLLGIVCAAGTLAGLLPSATRLLAAASQLMKNVMDDIFNVATEGPAQTWVTRGFIVLIALIALLFWVYLKASLVDLLLFVYNGQAQFVPGILLGLYWPRVALPAVATGLIAGEIAALGLTMHPIPLAGLNPGFAALALNTAIVVLVTLCVRKTRVRTGGSRRRRG